jgi:hypothetical protein
MAADLYLRTLLDIATERINPQTLSLPSLDPSMDPQKFLHNLFSPIAAHRIPITREGTERLMDILFANPMFVPLLENATASQEALAAVVAPVATDAFLAYWTHIIVPAWNHHVDLHRVLRSTRSVE